MRAEALAAEVSALPAWPPAVPLRRGVGRMHAVHVRFAANWNARNARAELRERVREAHADAALAVQSAEREVARARRAILARHYAELPEHARPAMVEAWIARIVAQEGHSVGLRELEATAAAAREANAAYAALAAELDALDRCWGEHEDTGWEQLTDHVRYEGLAAGVSLDAEEWP